MARKPNSGAHVRRLRKAGFEPVSKFRLALAKTGLFSAFDGKKRLMPRRTVHRFFWCGGNDEHIAFELSLATAGLQSERGAVALSVAFFNVWGHKLHTSSENGLHQFFADPLEKVSAQTGYFRRPHGACWCRVSVQRSTLTQRIGLIGKVKHARPRRFQLLSPEEALAGRDRMQLLAQLDEAKKSKDRAAACLVLERMIYLENRPYDRRLLRLISDIEETLSAYRALNPVAAETSMFKYDGCLTDPYAETMPLSKWLASEAVSLKKQADGRLISVENGNDPALRVLAVGVAGAQLHIADESSKGVSSHDWIFDSDFDAILSFQSVRADL